MTDVCYHDFPPYKPGVERICRKCKLPASTFRQQYANSLQEKTPIVRQPEPTERREQPPPEKPRQRRDQPEKREQAQIVKLLEAIGAKWYEIGRPRQQKCHHCGMTSKDLGTRQTPGFPDIFVFLPLKKNRGPFLAPPFVLIEVKGPDGSLSPEQREFRDYCRARAIPHVDGTYERVYQWLRARHFVEAA